MTDGQLPRKGLEGLFLENLGDQAHLLVDDEPRPVGDRDTCGFLTPVLEREKGEERETGHIHLGCVDGEHPALLAG